MYGKHCMCVVLETSLSSLYIVSTTISNKLKKIKFRFNSESETKNLLKGFHVQNMFIRGAKGRGNTKILHPTHFLSTYVKTTQQILGFYKITETILCKDTVWHASQL